MLGYIDHYFSNGVSRYGIKISFDITDKPIWLKREKKDYSPMKRYCYHPNLVPFMKLKAYREMMDSVNMKEM